MARILVIDHDALMRATVAAILKSAGHEVTLAEDGWRGFSLCHVSHVDVAIICLFMPDQGGLEALKSLRKEFPSLPTIAFSTRAGGKDLSAFARWLGATRTLAKPCGAEALLAAIEEVHAVNRDRSDRSGAPVA